MGANPSGGVRASAGLSVVDCHCDHVKYVNDTIRYDSSFGIPTPVLRKAHLAGKGLVRTLEQAAEKIRGAVRRLKA